MLVLSRRAGEWIDIGDDTTVRIQAIVGNRVVIGVSAPLNRKILRGELEARSNCGPSIAGDDSQCVAMTR